MLLLAHGDVDAVQSALVEVLPVAVWPSDRQQLRAWRRRCAARGVAGPGQGRRSAAAMTCAEAKGGQQRCELELELELLGGGVACNSPLALSMSMSIRDPSRLPSHHRQPARPRQLGQLALAAITRCLSALADSRCESDMAFPPPRLITLAQRPKDRARSQRARFDVLAPGVDWSVALKLLRPQTADP